VTTGWRKLTVYIGYIVAIVVILSAFAVSVTRFLSPFLNQNRSRFEQYLSVILQHPVTIQHVEITWDFLKPTLSFSHVALINSTTHLAVLTIDDLHVAPAIWRSLRAWELLPDNLKISGLDLAFVAQKNGDWKLNGLQLSASHLNETAGWIFAHPYFLLQNIRIQMKKLNGDKYSVYLGSVQINAFWNGEHGAAHLSGENVLLQSNKIFRTPIYLATISGGMIVTKTIDGLFNLNVKKLRLINADIDSTTNFVLSWSKTMSPKIDLRGQFLINHAENVSEYLPSQFFGPKLNHWLNAAFLSGNLDQGNVVLRGQLNNFPFDAGDGEFTVKGEVHDLNLHFADNWPNLNELNGRLLFSGRKMQIDAQSGSLSAATIQSLQVKIPRIVDDLSLLEISGNIAGDFRDGFGFVVASPLKNKLLPYFSLLNPSGEMELALQMSIPLDSPDKVKLSGNIDLINDNLSLFHDKLLFKKLNGKLNFSEHGVSSINLSGFLFDKLTKITTENIKLKSALMVNILGEISADNLQSWSQIKLQNIIQGSAKYKAQFILSNDINNFQLNVFSDLTGMQINLFNFYQKSKSELLPINLQTNISPLAPSNIHLTINNSTGTGLFGGSTSADIGVTGDQIQLSLDNKQLKGKILFLQNKLAYGIDARFDCLHYFSTENTNTATIDPRVIPELTIVANEFWYNNIALGRVSLKLLPKALGMQIRQLDVVTKVGQLHAIGNWLFDRSNLSGELDTDHPEKLLNVFSQQRPSFEAGKTMLKFKLNWPGAPWLIALKNLSGDVAIKMNKGRVINLSSDTNTQVGFGRMLNIFSLQSIPRRLSLDFSDLFDKGYNFDSASGDFIFRSGDAITQNTKFKGTVAEINAIGRIGFVNKDYDIKLNVTPHVTSSLPIVATIATANPLAGLAAWVVEKAMNRQVSRLVTYHYSITGPWNDPVWQKINADQASNTYMIKHLLWGRVS